MKKIKILLADDHQILLDGLTAMLNTEPDFEIVATAKNGQQVIQILREKAVDVLVLDLSMPEMDGMETTKIVKKLFPDLKIIILTTNDEGSIITELLRQGAIGYMLKNSSQAHLIKGIRRAYEGKTVLNSEVTAKMVESFRQPKTPTLQKDTPRITRREKEVLQLISEEYTAQEIANKLSVSLNTIITHRRNLFVKLDVKNSVGLVKKAMQRGIL